MDSTGQDYIISRNSGINHIGQRKNFHEQLLKDTDRRNRDKDETINNILLIEG